MEHGRKLLVGVVFIIVAGLFWLFGGPESGPKAGVDADKPNRDACSERL